MTREATNAVMLVREGTCIADAAVKRVLRLAATVAEEKARSDR